jgi:hypothetical protein
MPVSRQTIFRFAHRRADELREFLPDLDAAEFSRLRLAPYSEEDYLRDLFAVTRGRVNPELAHTLFSLTLAFKPAGF